VKAGWEVKTLGEVASITNGGTPKSDVKQYWGGDIAWLTPKDMGKLKSKLASNTSRMITAEGLSKCSAKLIPENSVILSTRAPIGHLAINTVPMAFNQGCRGLVPNDNLSLKYLFHYLSANVDVMNELGTGTTFKELSAGALKSLPIPLPPLEEQKRIVSILDEAFEGLDRARENAEANLKSARELFESQLNEYFSTTPSDWVSQKLNNITTKIGSGATPKGGAKAYKTEGIPLIRSLNVHDRWFKADKLAYIDDGQAEKLSNVVVQEGDVLLNITGASVARCCVAPFEYLPARVNQHVSIIRPSRNVLSPEFLALMLTSKPYKDLLLRTGEDNGSTRQALTKSQIQDLEVAFPQQLTRQKEAVLALKAASQTTKQLNEAYTTKLKDISDLRQSLLQKAFAGELT
jgi:type I restriction enzyme S subunit